MGEERVLPSLAKSTDEYMAAFELAEDGYLEEAEKHAIKSIEFKKNIEAIILLVDIIERLGKDSSKYQKMLKEEFPTNPDTYRRLFLSSFEKDKEKALSYINRAINLMKKSIYYYDKSKLLHTMNRSLEALAAIDIAIRMENRTPEYWNQRAVVLLKLKKTNDAKESSEVSLKLDQRNRDALLMLGRIYLNSGDREKAREMLTQIDNRDEEVKKLLEETLS